MYKKNLGLTKEILENLYSEEEKTAEEISILFNCHRQTIINRLRTFQISVRLPAHLRMNERARKKISDSKKGKKLSEKHKKNIGLGGKGKHMGRENGNWKGGRIKDKGYILLRVREHPKARNKYVGEHIIVMEKFIGRFLKKKEIVHHKNRVRDDNTIENLKVFKNQSEHIRFHNLQKGKRKKYV